MDTGAAIFEPTESRSPHRATTEVTGQPGAEAAFAATRATLTATAAAPTKHETVAEAPVAADIALFEIAVAGVDPSVAATPASFSFGSSTGPVNHPEVAPPAAAALVVAADAVSEHGNEGLVGAALDPVPVVGETPGAEEGVVEGCSAVAIQPPTSDEEATASPASHPDAEAPAAVCHLAAATAGGAATLSEEVTPASGFQHAAEVTSETSHAEPATAHMSQAHENGQKTATACVEEEGSAHAAGKEGNGHAHAASDSEEDEDEGEVNFDNEGDEAHDHWDHLAM